MTIPLRFLDFEHSDDDGGVAVFDAMASVQPDRLPDLHAEIAAVLAWAHGQFGPPAPLDEAGELDYDLTSVTESSRSETLAFDPVSNRLIAAAAGTAGVPRHATPSAYR